MANLKLSDTFGTGWGPNYGGVDTLGKTRIVHKTVMPTITRVSLTDIKAAEQRSMTIPPAPKGEKDKRYS